MTECSEGQGKRLIGAERFKFARLAVSTPGTWKDKRATVIAAGFAPELCSEGRIKAAMRDFERLRARWGEIVPEKPTEGQPPSVHQGGERTSDTPPADVDTLLADDDVGGYTFEDMLSLAESLAEISNAADPVITHHTIKMPGDRPAAILFPSCSHLGGRYTHYQGFRQMLNEALAIDGLYWAPLGDDIEGFLPGFPDTSATMGQPLSPEHQLIMLGLFVQKLAKAGRLLLGMHSQHGGDWFEKRHGYNPVKRAYLRNRVPFFDGQAYIKLEVGEQTYNVAMSHQFPGHSMYNRLHPQARAMREQFPNADVIVQGDKHTYAMSETTSYVWEVDAGNRVSPFVWFVQTGTAKTGPDKYTIKRWGRGVFEWPVLVFHHDDHYIEATRSLRTARLILEAARAQKESAPSGACTPGDSRSGDCG